MRMYYPIGRKLTPMGRGVWYQLDKRYPGSAFVGVEEDGRLVWSGVIHASHIKDMGPDDWDKPVEEVPRGREVALALSERNGQSRRRY